MPSTLIVELKYLFFLLMGCIFLILTSCNDERIDIGTEQLSLEEFSQKNVSFFDARIRSINETQYVRELYFVNFSDVELRIDNTYFEGRQYSDNGEGLDLVANDGIFTSIDLFQYNERVQYDSSNPNRSVLDRPIVSPNFIHYEKLAELEVNYHFRGLPKQARTRLGLEINCNIIWTGGGCKACDWWGGGYCDWCFTFPSNCVGPITF